MTIIGFRVKWLLLAGLTGLETGLTNSKGFDRRISSIYTWMIIEKRTMDPISSASCFFFVCILWAFLSPSSGEYWISTLHMDQKQYSPSMAYLHVTHLKDPSQYPLHSVSELQISNNNKLLTSNRWCRSMVCFHSHFWNKLLTSRTRHFPFQ